jgi:hypothetical protein
LCIHNELIALHERHLLDTPQPEQRAINKAFAIARRKLGINNTKLEKWSEQKVLSTKKGHLLKRYTEAYRLNALEGLPWWAGNVKMFLKHDKDVFATLLDKVPRCVQHRHPRYNAAIALYLMAVEEYIFKKNKLQSNPKTTVFAKGADTFRRAERILAMRKWGDKTAYIEMDHSRWDAHQVPALLEQEHKIYNDLMQHDPTLKRLLRRQIINRCTSKNGIKYISYGKRMSGDYNTGLGNSIVNFAVLSYCFRKFKNPQIYLDGDDSVVAVHEDELTKLDLEDFKRMGQTTKIDQIQSDPYKVRFCQSVPVLTKAGPRMVREPTRAISRTKYTTHHYKGVGWYKYLSSVAECEIACNRGVPIMEAYARALKRLSNGYKTLPMDSLPYELKIRMNFEKDPGPMEITEDARLTFDRAFGISPASQRYWEDFYDKWQPTDHIEDLLGLRVVTREWDSSLLPSNIGLAKNPYA